MTQTLALSPALPLTQPLPPTVRLQARSRWAPADLREIWRYRDLLAMLGWRDVQVRYKQTILGAAWAVLQPLISMVVFTIFFGRLLGVPRMSDPVFVFAGVVPWTLFSAIVTAATQSLLTNADILQKIYFPRLILPLAAAVAPGVDFAISLAVLGGLMLWSASPLTAALLLIVPLSITLATAALAVGVLMAALTAAYRDFRFVVPFLLQLGFFITPVLYPQSLIPDRFRWISSLNPMAGVIENFRAAVLGGPLDLAGWLASAVVAAAGLAAALFYFARVERRLADVI